MTQIRDALSRPKVLNAGGLFLTLTIVFLMALVIMSIFNMPVPCDARFLVTAIVSFGAALAAALIGGNASARGALRIPSINDSPLVITLGGGAAVLILMFVLQSFLYSERDCSINGKIPSDEALQIALLKPDVDWRLTTYERLCCKATDTIVSILNTVELGEPTPEALEVIKVTETARSPDEVRVALENYNVAACGGDLKFAIHDGMVLCANGTEVPFVPSPNIGAGDMSPELVILHSTGSSAVEPAIATLINPQLDISAHILISRSGGIAQLVPLNRPAFHAGAGEWRNVKNLNYSSIGISFANAGAVKRRSSGFVDSFGREIAASEVATVAGNPQRFFQRYTDEQLKVAVALIKEIGSIPTVLHGHTSPKRDDPGPAFPYQDLCVEVLCPEDLQTTSTSEGYVYYETTADALPTKNGRLVPAAGGNILFADIHRGHILQALSTVRMREEPTSNSRLLGTIGAGTCIIVTGLKKNLQQADRGGWLPISNIECPKPS